MMPSFVLPANTGTSSPDTIERKRRMAQAMLMQGTSGEPIQHWSQGVNKMAQALLGGLAIRNADKQEAEGRKSANDALVRALTGGKGVSQGDDPQGALVEAMNNPFMSPQGSAMAMDMWQKKNTPPDPMADLERRKMELEIAGMENPQPEFRPATAAEKQQYGVPPETPLVIGKNGPQILKPNTNNNGITIGPDGTVQIGGAMPKMTEQQSKDAGFFNRASQVAPMLDGVDKALTEAWSANVGKAPIVGNYLKSDAYRQAEQMGREFLAPILRKDTGAAVTDEELATYGGMYLPQPGDDAGTLQQKREARKRAVEGLKVGVPTQAILMLEQQRRMAGQNQPPPNANPPAAQPSGNPPPGVDPELWNVMTPEEKSLWQN